MLIPDFRIWLQRKHADIYFSTAHPFGIAESPFYPLCANIVQSPGNVFFDSLRFCIERASLNRHLICEVSLDNIMDIIVHSENQWVLVANFVRSVLVEFRNDCNWIRP